MDRTDIVNQLIKLIKSACLIDQCLAILLISRYRLHYIDYFYYFLIAISIIILTPSLNDFKKPVRILM